MNVPPERGKKSAFVTSLQAGGGFCIRGMGRVLFFVSCEKAFPIRSTVSSCFLLCPSTLEDLRFLKTYKSIKPLFFYFIAQIYQHEVHILRSSRLCSSINGSTNHQKSMLHPSLSTPPVKKNNKKTNQQNSNATSTPTESKNASLLHLNVLPMQMVPSPASPKALPLPPKQKKKKKKQQPKTQPFLLFIPFLLLQQKDNATSTNPVNRLA